MHRDGVYCLPNALKGEYDGGEAGTRVGNEEERGDGDASFRPHVVTATTSVCTVVSHHLAVYDSSNHRTKTAPEYTSSYSSTAAVQQKHIYGDTATAAIIPVTLLPTKPLEKQGYPLVPYLVAY